MQPGRAHVRRTSAWSIKPLSSRKTRLWPSHRAFVYTRPPSPPPALDRVLVALRCPALGLLRTPAASAQNLPHVRRMVVDAEGALDDRRPPGERLQLRSISVCLGSLEQHPQQLLPLVVPTGEPGVRAAASLATP